MSEQKKPDFDPSKFGAAAEELADKAADMGIALDLIRERGSQRERGYTSDHDDQHGLIHLLDVIDEKVDLARHAETEGMDWLYMEKELIEAGATVIAALRFVARGRAADEEATPATKPKESKS